MPDYNIIDWNDSLARKRLYSENLREYRRLEAHFRHLRNPEKSREASRRRREKHPRPLMDPVEKHKSMSESAKRRWADPEYKAKVLAARQTPEARQHRIAGGKKHADAVRQQSKERWKDPILREKMLLGVAKAVQARWNPDTPLKQDLRLLQEVIRDLKAPLIAERNRKYALDRYFAQHERQNSMRRTGKCLARAFKKVLRRQAERRKQLGRTAKRMLVTRVEQRIARSLRRRFNKAMGLRYRSSYIERLCGCPLLDLRRHLEKLFLPGMTWDNYGFIGWHIDHIRPCASFNLKDLEQQRQCFHWTNLQPLWAEDNLAKRDKLLS